MSARQKTWSALEAEIKETFRKWGRVQPTITNILPRRSLQKRWHDATERAVGIEFPWYGKDSGHRIIKLRVTKEDRAQENLELIAIALETIRMAEVRGVTNLLLVLYRQMYPTASAPPPPPPPAGVGSTGPYAVLHVANDAPLAVAEAAYKALIRIHHPDIGGSTVQAQAINAAIERIRKEKAK